MGFLDDVMSEIDKKPDESNDVKPGEKPKETPPVQSGKRIHEYSDEFKRRYGKK